MHRWGYAYTFDLFVPLWSLPAQYDKVLASTCAQPFKQIAGDWSPTQTTQWTSITLMAINNWFYTHKTQRPWYKKVIKKKMTETTLSMALVIVCKHTCSVLVLPTSDKLRVVYLAWLRPQNRTATIPAK